MIIATLCTLDLAEPIESTSNVIYITWSSNGNLGSKFKFEWTRIELKISQQPTKCEIMIS